MTKIGRYFWLHTDTNVSSGFQLKALQKIADITPFIRPISFGPDRISTVILRISNPLSPGHLVNGASVEASW